jgi:hypothetical protein
MKTSRSFSLVVSCAFACLAGFSGKALAVNRSLDGIYSGAGTGTQVLVSRGRPVSNAILNNHQSFSDSFIQATESSNPGGLNIEYDFQETTGQSTFTVRYYSSSTGDLLLTFISVIKVVVVSDSDTSFTTRTEWTMNMSSSLLGEIPLSTEVITESYQFNLTTFVCIYIYDNGSSITLNRIGTGTGSTQGSPLIPRNPVWSRPTTLGFPIISPNSTIWCDPPFASSFQYDVAAGRKERMASVTLPKGFGKVQLLAQPSAGGGVRLVGSYPAGAKVNLLSKSWLKKGTKKLVIRNIKPKVDIKKKSPYPVGLTFTGLDESAAKLKIQAKQISPRR